PIRLGLGITYCGTSNRVSDSSTPPMITTATMMMAKTSPRLRIPGPALRADMPEMPTLPPPPDLDLNSGMASLICCSSLRRRGGRSGAGVAALLLAHDFLFDDVGK